MEERRGGQILGSPGAFPTDQRGARKGRALGNSGEGHRENGHSRLPSPSHSIMVVVAEQCVCGSRSFQPQARGVGQMGPEKGKRL